MTTAEMALFFTIGLGLGGLHLGGLWLTVNWLTRLERPLSILAVSAIVRGGLLVGALALATGLQWERLIACIAGFAAARFVITAWTRARPVNRDNAT